jgi:O-antigen/teichoic acid export membrane protein
VLLRVRPSVRGGFARLRALWPRSRWFLAEFGTAFPSDQGYLFLLPVLLGTGSFGLYRAASGLIGPVVVLFLAAGNVGLPEAVRSLRDGGPVGLRRFTMRLTAVVVAGTALYCGAVAALAEPLLRLVYGEPFAPAATITVFVAAQYVLNSVAFGAGVAMKAAGRMKALWVVRAFSVVVTISSVAVLAGLGGLEGAGVAAVVAGAVYAAGVLTAYRLARPGVQPRRRGGAHRRVRAPAR